MKDLLIAPALLVSAQTLDKALIRLPILTLQALNDGVNRIKIVRVTLQLLSQFKLRNVRVAKE